MTHLPRFIVTTIVWSFTMWAIITGAIMPVSAFSATTTTIRWQSATWNIFHGTGNLGQIWNPNRVKIDPITGHLLEIAKANSAGGVGDPTRYLYGHWVSRLRMSPGLGSKYSMMLISSNGGQEIDFAENRNYDLDPNRQELTASIHYGIFNGKSLTDRYSIPIDMTKFHQVGVIWAKDSITFKVDGKVWWVVTDHLDAKNRWRRVSDLGMPPSGTDIKPGMHASIQTNKYGDGPRSVLEVSYFKHTA